MKHLIVVGDGMADEPQALLEGKTPLEAAATPNMDRIAARGRVERLRTSYAQLPVGSIVANMALLGYDPRRYHPAGRASFEAKAHGIELAPGEIAFRCNLISLDAQHRIADFTAGQIPCADARRILASLEPPEGMRLVPGLSYRNLLLWRDIGCAVEEIEMHEPHECIGVPFRGILPRGRGIRAEKRMRELRAFLERSRRQISARPEGASMLWPWSASRRPRLPDFRELWGLRAGLVCGMDFLIGIARSAGIEAIPVPGATAYIDTDYEAKLERALSYLERFDFVFVHVNAPDEESHQHRLEGKIRSIELIDERILGPLLERLDRRYPAAHRIAVLPDHVTRVRDGRHGRAPVPVAISGSGIVPDGARRYREREASGVPIRAHRWLERLIGPRSPRRDVATPAQDTTGTLRA